MARGNRIPVISDERLAELAPRISPVVRFARGGYRHYKTHNVVRTSWLGLSPKGKLMQHESGPLFYIEPLTGDALRDTAFTWDPTPDRVAEGLVHLGAITTYHTFGYYGFFKPSVAEVLAQIPAELVDKVCAFGTKGPEDVDDLNRYLNELNEGYHVAQTKLYAPER